MKKDKTMFIVDFGLAKEYIDPDTNKHIPYRLENLSTGFFKYVLFLLQRAQEPYWYGQIHVDKYSPGEGAE
jgi:hypothetical protein